MKKIDPLLLHNFTETVWEFYKRNKRGFVWRKNITGYRILVSEIMLQQTQVERISMRFPQFLNKFPTLQNLAEASLADVLTEWQGLGYNRRGKFLWESANKLITEYDGNIPTDPELLTTFPGIGINTAGSIIAFAHNLPVVFIETNIRRVFIHHFFSDELEVNDKDILPLIAATVDEENAREWYWALMDYGTYLKKAFPNANRRSKHYTKQSEFEGSNRQVRATILRFILASKKPVSFQDIQQQFQKDETRIEQNLTALEKEGMIVKKGDKWFFE